MLKEIIVKTEYRSLHDNIVKDFYIPLLSESIFYKRSVGFFSSKILIGISYGIEKLIKNEGTIKLICSPNLDKEDIDAINSGYNEKLNNILEKNMCNMISDPTNKFEEERLNFLAHLISSGKLDIKVALSYKDGKYGLYHEKLGLFYDKDSNVVAFSGSMNETYNAISENYETVDVFKSWTDNDRVIEKEKAFDKLWNNNDSFACVLNFPTAVKEKIILYKKDSFDLEKLSSETKIYLDSLKEIDNKYKYNDTPYIDDSIILRDYQKNAIKKWSQNNYCGIYDMATGSGKTYTAYASIVTLINHCVSINKPILVIVICPYQHLVEQWMEDIDKFHIDNKIIGYGNIGDKDYLNKLKRSIRDLKEGIKKYQFFITTNASYRLSKIQDIVSNTDGVDVLLAVDEAHYVGTQSFSKYLHENYKYRLALSATINRYRDEEGTRIIHNYFGNVCIKYTIEDGIKDGNLCRYYYYPIINILTDDERKEYKDLTDKIRKLCSHEDDININNTNEQLKLLLIIRSLVIASANNKLFKLKEEISKIKNENYILVYCGATRVLDYDQVNDIELRQIDQVTRILGNELNMDVRRYTSKEDINERIEIRKAFQNGPPVNALVAIKCLDEGVNIPNIRKAFVLASTTNPREYIQRRGRILRNAKGKEYAYLYDFVTLPYDIDTARGMDVNDLNIYKSLIKNEISRIDEYFSSAENKSTGYQLIFDLNEAFKLNKDIEGG